MTSGEHSTALTAPADLSNRALAPLRKLAEEASFAGLLPAATASAVRAVKGARTLVDVGELIPPYPKKENLTGRSAEMVTLPPVLTAGAAGEIVIPWP
jgi:hypothetical protein